LLRSVLVNFSFHGAADPRDLHSFPTRRSSDLAALGLLAFSAAAQEMQIRLVTAFPENMAWSQALVKWSERVNAQGKGLVKINFIDRKSTRLNSSHDQISYAVFCLKKKKNKKEH